MASNRKTLDIENFLSPDKLGTHIANNYLAWEKHRHGKLEEWREIQQYIFATDTSKTSNAKLPWSNKTTIPKLCQIRDNLHANYMASLFPKRKWLSWIGESRADEDALKKKSIESYIGWSVDRPGFYREVSKLVLDYIDYGNYFATVEWTDDRVDNGTSIKAGYVGPSVRRISPLDIVFNPTASEFANTPKIIRSIVSIGEIKKELEAMSQDEGEREFANELWKYLTEVRAAMNEYEGDVRYKDEIYHVAGFDSYRDYLNSNTIEVLTFYGDLYDEETETLYENHIIKIVDRCKVLYMKPANTMFSQPQIYHGGWRVRPDNLWAMGPLDNLVGMQYRIDHLENMKADVFDLIAYPPMKVKGYVEDFEWGPMERIYLGDDGDIELMSPDVQALQADTQIAILEAKMEEMSGSPREAMGFRTPGEKTKYEVQQLQNAAGRIFQSKTAQFERDGLEDILNGMLESARRNMTPTTIRVFDEEEKVGTFRDLTPEDITGNGRIRPIAARHFAEQANLVQNINQFYNSAIGQDQGINVHFSGEKLARMFETLLDIESYNIVEPYIRISEQAEAQRMANVNEEEVLMESQTATGLNADDVDL